MKLFCFLATFLFFMIPAISLLIDKEGRLCWILCFLYFFLHIVFKKYVYIFHKLDNIEHRFNVFIKN